MQAHSPLAGCLRPVEAAGAGSCPGVRLAVGQGMHILELAALAGSPDLPEQAARLLGMPLPATGESAKAACVTVLGIAPERWYVLASDQSALTSLREALSEAVVVLDGALAILQLSGPRVQALLMKGLPLDLEDPRHAPGRTFTSRIGKTRVTIYRTGFDAFTLFVPRSLALFFCEWLEQAACDIGLAIEE